MQDINICDDEKTDLLSNDNYAKCYVCLNYTLLISPCKCKSPICNDCFSDVVKNNGSNCTICKDKFNEDILKEIKIEEINSDDENYEEDDLEDDDEDFDILCKKNFFILLRIFFGILFIPFIGLIFSQFNYNNNVEYELFTLNNFIIGGLILSFLLLFYIVIYSLNRIINNICKICLRIDNQ